MLLDHNGVAPRIHPSARVAPTAVVCGDVTIGPNSSIGFGAVLTAESGPIEIGANCVIMDTAVIRGLNRHPVRIGDNVLVGPRAYLTGCEVADSVFLRLAQPSSTAQRSARARRCASMASSTFARCSHPTRSFRSIGSQSATPHKFCRRTSTRRFGQYRRSSTSRTTSSVSRASRP